MAKVKNGDLKSLMIVFVMVIVFVPLVIKYLSMFFGPVVSGFQNMVMPEGLPKPVRYSNMNLPCRSPDPATGKVCDEGTFCDGATNTCVSISA
jgi:hypothetical protein